LIKLVSIKISIGIIIKKLFNFFFFILRYFFESKMTAANKQEFEVQMCVLTSALKCHEPTEVPKVHRFLSLILFLCRWIYSLCKLFINYYI